jgi:penicillin-binding protein 2
MLVFDQLKKNDPQLRLLALMVVAGLFVLLAGLWWVQVVSSRDYQQHLETQASRTVRIPAMRGKILDRSGTNVLAENQPRYNVSLYLEELREQFQKEYARSRPRHVVTNSLPFWRRWLGSSAVSTQYVKLRKDQLDALAWTCRYQVASNAVAQLSQRLQLPMALDFTNFQKHYASSLYVPYPVATKVDASQIARFEEQFGDAPGVGLEVQSMRLYPNQTSAAHLVGYLLPNNDSIEGEWSDFSYRLPDFRGVIGIEGGFDAQLHGRAGEKSILVNSQGYHQTENVWTPAEPGRNVVLTLDLGVQKAAEHALQTAPHGAETRGAVVVMDVRTGDVLAMVSSPTFDPNDYINGASAETQRRLSDPRLRPQINRATQENYAPGSIFKTIVAMACLEKGLDPKSTVTVLPNPKKPGEGVYYLGRPIGDTVPPGVYDFRRALIRSSNSYFIHYGVHLAGIETILKYARRLHLGERMALPTRQETRGILPSDQDIRAGWSEGETANICIGQGKIAVSPLQMAVLASSLANGGKVLWPRLVDRIEPQDPLSTELTTHFPKGQVRDTLGIRPSTLKIIVDAMRDDVEDQDEGTGKAAFIPGFRICSKTGTAQVMNEQGHKIDQTTWFLSFAPYENPRYAVVVMVESGASGGTTCAPIAKQIYQAIIDMEKKPAVRLTNLTP